MNTEKSRRGKKVVVIRYFIDRFIPFSLLMLQSTVFKIYGKYDKKLKLLQIKSKIESFSSPLLFFIVFNFAYF